MKKRKKLIWAGSIFLAFVSAMAVYFMLLQAEKSTLAAFGKETVFVTKRQISKGQKIDADNYQLFMEKVELDAKAVPEAALKDAIEAAQMVSCWNIEEGVVLTRGMFQTFEEITKTMTEPVVAGLKADDIYQVSGGILRSGDRIHIFGVNEDGSVSLKWSNIYVQEVFDGAGNIISAADTGTSAQRINIFLDKGEVERLYEDLNTGNLRVVKICE